MTQAGYSGTPLIRKLGIKEGYKIAVVDPPANYTELLGRLPAGVQLSDASAKTQFDFVHLFVKDAAALKRQVKVLRRRIVPNGMIWVSWPKKSSKVTTDLDGNVVRDIGLRSQLVDTKVCAVDETWSGLKFVIRVKDRG